MWREMAADDRIEVNVEGFKVVAYSFGSSTETVFCLNGGPGLAWPATTFVNRTPAL